VVKVYLGRGEKRKWLARWFGADDGDDGDDDADGWLVRGDVEAFLLPQKGGGWLTSARVGGRQPLARTFDDVLSGNGRCESVLSGGER
jgi:hypothetical protein